MGACNSTAKPVQTSKINLHQASNVNVNVVTPSIRSSNIYKQPIIVNPLQLNLQFEIPLPIQQ